MRQKHVSKSSRDDLDIRLEINARKSGKICAFLKNRLDILLQEGPNGDRIHSVILYKPQDRGRKGNLLPKNYFI